MLLENVLISFGPIIINHKSNKSNMGSVILATHNYIFISIFRFLLFHFQEDQIPDFRI